MQMPVNMILILPPAILPVKVRHWPFCITSKYHALSSILYSLLTIYNQFLVDVPFLFTQKTFGIMTQGNKKGTLV